MAKCGQLTLAKCGIGQIRFGQMRPNKDGQNSLAKCGHGRLDWLVLDVLRLTRPHPLSAQRTVASLTRLGRDLVADFTVVAHAATLDATVGSVSSTQPAVQQLVLDPFSRGPALTFLTQASELSHDAAPSNSQYQRSMLRYHVGWMYAQCPCTMFSRQQMS